MSWGERDQIKELKEEIKRLRAWKALALCVLTDDQLDFKPKVGQTMRQRLASLDNAP